MAIHYMKFKGTKYQNKKQKQHGKYCELCELDLTSVYLKINRNHLFKNVSYDVKQKSSVVKVIGII